MDILIVSSRIKLRCKDLGYTVKSLLEMADVSHSFMYDLEKRNRIPSADKLERIADCLDCSVDYLLGRTATPDRSGGCISPALSRLVDAAADLTDEEVEKAVEYVDFLRASRK